MRKLFLFLAIFVLGITLLHAEKKVFGEPIKLAEVDSRAMALKIEGDILYIGAGNSIYTYDISVPLKPKQLGRIDGLGNVRQIAVQNGIVYVSARESGMWILDAKNPRNIKLLSRYDSIELATGIEVAGNVVFLAQRIYGVEFIDVSDPKKPQHIAMRSTPESQSIYYKDGYLYSGEWGVGEITVFDVRDMKNIRKVDCVKLYGYGDGVDVRGNFLFASSGHHGKNTSKSDKENYGMGHRLEIFDISDKSTPKRVSGVQLPRFFHGSWDFWTPRANGNMVFCANSMNGFFAVDVSDIKNPKLVDRLVFSDPTGKSPKGTPSTPISSLEIADGVVYVSSLYYGVAVVPVESAKRENRTKGKPPINADYREKYPTNESEFFAWTPEVPAQVRSVALKDDIVYAACGDAGLRILKILKNGGFKELGRLPNSFAAHVNIDGNRLYVAQGLDGFSFYEIKSPTNLVEYARIPELSKDCNLALYVWSVSKNILAASARHHGIFFFDISDSQNPKNLLRTGGSPLWDEFFIDRPTGKDGKYSAMSFAYDRIEWYDVSDGKIKISNTSTANQVTQYDGICAFDDKCILTKGKSYAIVEPNSTDALNNNGMWDFNQLPNGCKTGIPRTDGKMLALTSRSGKTVSILDFSNAEYPTLKRVYNISGNPATAVFYKGKAIIPAGYQGLLIEKN